MGRLELSVWCCLRGIRPTLRSEIRAPPPLEISARCSIRVGCRGTASTRTCLPFRQGYGVPHLEVCF